MNLAAAFLRMAMQCQFSITELSGPSLPEATRTETNAWRNHETLSARNREVVGSFAQSRLEVRHSTCTLIADADPGFRLGGLDFQRALEIISSFRRIKMYMIGLKTARF